MRIAVIAELMPRAHDHPRLRQVFFGFLTRQEKSRFHPALPEGRQDTLREARRRSIVECQRHDGLLRFDPCDDGPEELCRAGFAEGVQAEKRARQHGKNKEQKQGPLYRHCHPPLQFS